MTDLILLSKKEFLDSYSYVTEKEYLNTITLINKAINYYMQYIRKGGD
jgi:hypothetical protein